MIRSDVSFCDLLQMLSENVKKTTGFYFSGALSLGQLAVFCQNDSILAADCVFVSHEGNRSGLLSAVLEFIGPVNLKTKSMQVENTTCISQFL